MTQVVRILAGDFAWDPRGGLVPGGAAALDARGEAVDVATLPELVRRHPRAEPDRGPGLVLPGLVDAHAHLELGALAGRVPCGGGLAAWVGRLIAERAALSPGDMIEGARAAARAMRDAGTVAVGDVATLLSTAPVLEEAGLSGVAFAEVVGASEEAAAAALDDARSRAGTPSAVVSTPAPHSVYATAAGAIRVLAQGGGVPTIHAAEHDDEDRWLLAGEGPFAPFLSSRGARPPGLAALPALEALGAIGPRTLLVHLVTAAPAQLAAARRAGATAVLCPRSNLHVGGRLADLEAIRRAGLPFLLGTDSLASTPDHDLLGEVAALLATFPGVPAGELLEAATVRGARALGLDRHPFVRTDSPHAGAVIEALARRARASA